MERLEGNVGLIVLSVIPPAALAGPAIVAAMRLVQDTHALILDLRETRGGSPDGVALLASFLFPDGDVHLNDVVQGAQGPSASTGRPPASRAPVTSIVRSTC